MSLPALVPSELVGGIVALFLTLFTFSYLLGDNVLFRLTIHIFIGVASAYVAVIVWYNVLMPQLLRPLLTGSTGERLILLFPLVLGVLLLAKVSQRFSGLGAWAVAPLVGIGAATVIGGAVVGTLIPQSMATVNGLETTAGGGAAGWAKVFEGGLFLAGTVTTLIYFQFSARPRPGGLPGRPAWIEAIAWVGQLFIAVALGALFAGVYAASLSAFVERWSSIYQLVQSFLLAQ